MVAANHVGIHGASTMLAGEMKEVDIRRQGTQHIFDEALAHTQITPRDDRRRALSHWLTWHTDSS
jgi:hypothetical protein